MTREVTKVEGGGMWGCGGRGRGGEVELSGIMWTSVSRKLLTQCCVKEGICRLEGDSVDK